ncbi:uncharacterized protein HGUI_01234 [Hanseniaspora guilliermondii]|uniref:Uncharacterized protein n=1 Tax=Hanseniaspora guilliermondii TaxID=56406 RepID=A0A1L0AXZ0_9ASCO|nr:uncharacterized protein HGUI_01234 [Hanseniaspora guilliermondii]
MDNDMNLPMGGSNRINKNYNINKQASPNNVSSQNQYKKYNHNPNLKNNNMNDQQFFNNFQNGFLRNATNINLGNNYTSKDDPENELLSLVLKTPDQSKALLNIFIKDFLDKSGMSKTGKIFEMENGGEIKHDHDFLIDIERESIKDALKIKRSFLNEWWQIFWDAFNAKAHKNGSKIAQEYYSFNISRKNLDFLCRQASMKAAFEQQILERKGEYQREAMNQQAGNPLGFNSFFGSGPDNFQKTNYNKKKGNTPQASNSRSNEFQKSPSHQEGYEGMGLNNADIMYKLKEQQNLQQHRQWKSEAEYNCRQPFTYNSAQGSPINGVKSDEFIADENENTNGHDIGEYGFTNTRNNTGKRRRSLQTQQMVQLRLNKITPLVKHNEYSTMNNLMNVKNGTSNATTPMSNVHSYQRGSVSSHTNDSAYPNGKVPYLSAYDEQLVTMDQRLANNRLKKNNSRSK